MNERYAHHTAMAAYHAIMAEFFKNAPEAATDSVPSKAKTAKPPAPPPVEPPAPPPVEPTAPQPVEPPAPQPVEPPVPPPPVDRNTVLVTASDVVRKGKASLLSELLAKYQAGKLSEVKDSQLEAFYSELQGL